MRLEWINPHSNNGYFRVQNLDVKKDVKGSSGVSLDLNLASSIKSRPVTPPFSNCLENKFPKKSFQFRILQSQFHILTRFG